MLYAFVVLVATAFSPVSFVIGQDTTIYDHFEVVPEPIGGSVAYLQWLNQTIKMTDAVYLDKAYGDALLSFVVEPNGDLSHIRLRSKLGPADEKLYLMLLPNQAVGELP